jgi:hypothetical protein
MTMKWRLRQSSVEGGTRAWKGEEDSGNGCGGDWAKDSPFYRGRREVGAIGKGMWRR